MPVPVNNPNLNTRQARDLLVAISAARPENWHPAANIFPLMSEEGLVVLAESIKQNGLQNPIVTLDGRVLDGRNRELACKMAGVPPTYTEWKGSGSPLSWVISQNLYRRHLKGGQKAFVALEAEKLFAKEKPPGRPRNGGNTSTIRGKSRDIAAGLVGVSGRYVQAAKKIAAADPKIADDVKAGRLSLSEAEKKLGYKQSTKAMVSAETNEWYTPPKYVEAIRKVLGEIDLDPASCATANKVVKAPEYYTKEDDGLKQKWFGRIILNPPYGDDGPKFVARLIKEYESGNVTEAVLLLNNHVTDTKWFQPLVNYLVCFTDHRSKFWNDEHPEGTSTSPTHGSLFVYLGKNPKTFEKHFKQFGTIWQRYG